MLSSGRLPNGSEVSKLMPFDSLAALSDVEAGCVFLKALPPAPVLNTMIALAVRQRCHT